MFNMHTITLEGVDYVVLQNGEGEEQVRLAFNRDWAGRVAVGMLQFALGLLPENTDTNEEETDNG